MFRPHPPPPFFFLGIKMFEMKIKVLRSDVIFFHSSLGFHKILKPYNEV